MKKMAEVLNAEVAKLFEAFLEYQKARLTREGYLTIKKNTYRFLQWLDGEGVDVTEATVRDCTRYRNMLGEYIKNDGTLLSIGTVQHRMQAGKRFFKYLVLLGKRKTNPFEAVAYPRMQDKLSRNVLTEAQRGRLLERLRHFDTAPTVREKIGRYRLHVIAEFLYATGLRIAEAASLIPSNIDVPARRVYVPEGKGKKPRAAFMTGLAAQVMEQYLKRGRDSVLGNYERRYGNTVFGSHPHRLMAVVNRGLSEVCKTLELPVITSHGFRYSLGTHLLKAGCDMRYIQAILGHEALSTTQVYTRVGKDDLKNSLDAYHPRNGWKV
jgi:integrase/recombinase XerD